QGSLSLTASINVTTNYVRDSLRLTGNNSVDIEVVSARNTVFLNISGSGTDNNGLQFTQTTTTRIEQSQVAGCTDHFVKGVLLIQSPGLDDESIDYGNGTCDDQATMTSNGTT